MLIGGNCSKVLRRTREDTRTSGGYKVLYPQWHGRSVFNTGKVLGHWPEKGELRLKVGFGKEVPEGVGIVGVFGVMDVGC